MVTVNQVMSERIVKIDAGMSTIDAAKLMAQHKIGSVFVKHEDQIVGTERVPYFMPVEEIMSTPVVSIDGRRPITEAADLMEQHGTRHLAVLQSGAVVGVLSVRDLLTRYRSMNSNRP